MSEIFQLEPEGDTWTGNDYFFSIHIYHYPRAIYSGFFCNYFIEFLVIIIDFNIGFSQEANSIPCHRREYFCPLIKSSFFMMQYFDLLYTTQCCYKPRFA